MHYNDEHVGDWSRSYDEPTPRSTRRRSFDGVNGRIRMDTHRTGRLRDERNSPVFTMSQFRFIYGIDPSTRTTSAAIIAVREENMYNDDLTSMEMTLLEQLDKIRKMKVEREELAPLYDQPQGTVIQFNMSWDHGIEYRYCGVRFGDDNIWALTGSRNKNRMTTEELIQFLGRATIVRLIGNQHGHILRDRNNPGTSDVSEAQTVNAVADHGQDGTHY